MGYQPLSTAVSILKNVLPESGYGTERRWMAMRSRNNTEAHAERLWWRFVMAGLLPLTAKSFEYLPDQLKQDLLALASMLHGDR